MKTYDQLTKELNTYEQQLATVNNECSLSISARQSINSGAQLIGIM